MHNGEVAHRETGEHVARDVDAVAIPEEDDHGGKLFWRGN